MEFMGSCYIHFDERETWTSAEQHCQVLNSHLVSISSQEEQEFVKSEFNLISNKIHIAACLSK